MNFWKLPNKFQILDGRPSNRYASAVIQSCQESVEIGWKSKACVQITFSLEIWGLKVFSEKYRCLCRLPNVLPKLKENSGILTNVATI